MSVASDSLRSELATRASNPITLMCCGEGGLCEGRTGRPVCAFTIAPGSEGLVLTAPHIAGFWSAAVRRRQAGEEAPPELDPCEFVLVWCAYELFGLTGEIEVGAGAENYPLPQLADVLSRTPHVIAEAMWTVRGMRESALRESGVFTNDFSSRPADVDALYLRVLAGARDAGIGPDSLPDYLCLDVEGRRWQNYRRKRAASQVVWFGDQLAADENYFWAVDGGGISPASGHTTVYRTPIDRLGLIVIDGKNGGENSRVRFVLSDGTGFVGGARIPQPVPLSKEECSRLRSWARTVPIELSVLSARVPGIEEPAKGTSEGRPEAARRSDSEEEATLATASDWTERDSSRYIISVLDRIGGIATQKELRAITRKSSEVSSAVGSIVTRDIDEIIPITNVQWLKPGREYVAVGSSDADTRRRLAPIIALLEIVSQRSGTQSDVARARRGAGRELLVLLGTKRYAGLCLPLGLDTPDALRTNTGDRDQPVGRAATSSRGAQGSAPAGGGPSGNTAVAMCSDDIESPEVPHRSKGTAAPIRPRPTPPPMQELPSTGRVGTKLRVYLDVEGFRTIATCDPRTGAMTITKGTLEGRRFEGPTEAAAAVVQKTSVSQDFSGDGWQAWRVHDRSQRTLFSAAEGWTP